MNWDDVKNKVQEINESLKQREYGKAFDGIMKCLKELSIFLDDPQIKKIRAKFIALKSDLNEGKIDEFFDTFYRELYLKMYIDLFKDEFADMKSKDGKITIPKSKYRDIVRFIMDHEELKTSEQAMELNNIGDDQLEQNIKEKLDLDLQNEYIIDIQNRLKGLELYQELKRESYVMTDAARKKELKLNQIPQSVEEEVKKFKEQMEKAKSERDKNKAEEDKRRKKLNNSANVNAEFDKLTGSDKTQARLRWKRLNAIRKRQGLPLLPDPDDTVPLVDKEGNEKIPNGEKEKEPDGEKEK